jgi:hypothetical protein
MPDQDGPEIGASPNTWCSIVRRAQLASSVKLVAFTMATYADNHTGESIYPGVARLVVDTDTSPSTVKRAIATLVRVGLLERTERGDRRNGRSDVYRLVTRADVLDHVEVRSPDEHKAIAAAVKRDMSRRVSRSTATSAPPVYGSPAGRKEGSTGHPWSANGDLYGSPVTHHQAIGTTTEPEHDIDHGGAQRDRCPTTDRAHARPRDSVTPTPQTIR